MLAPSHNLWLVPAAYLVGSIPFGLILARIFAATDVRKAGSGNIGATNVARVAGPIPGILTLVLDATKGAAAVLLAGYFSGNSSTWMMLAGATALVGHCYPPWLRFKGGKGVAPALGVFAALCLPALLLDLGFFIVVLLVWRYVSLASIAAAAGMPLLVYVLWAPGHAPPLVVTFGTLFCSGLVVFKHDANLQRLVEGTEPHFFSRKSKQDKA